MQIQILTVILYTADLTLYCLSKLRDPAVSGLALALCCHHRCTWTSYVGINFLQVNCWLLEIDLVTLLLTHSLDMDTCTIHSSFYCEFCFALIAPQMLSHQGIN